jgi:hypothetical protein
MSKQNIISQIYGYAICLVTILIIIFSIPSLVDSVIDLSNLSVSSNLGTRYLSFESYKNQFINDQKDLCSCDVENKGKTVYKLPSDSTLQKLYNEEKISQIHEKQFKMNKNIISKILWIIVCSILFLFHWRWVRKFAVKVE